MELVVFTITAIVALIGAVAMLLSKNAIHSALFLLLSFFAWKATLGRVAEVSVAYAQVFGQGGAAPAALESGRAGPI